MQPLHIPEMIEDAISIIKAHCWSNHDPFTTNDLITLQEALRSGQHEMAIPVLQKVTEETSDDINAVPWIRKELKRMKKLLDWDDWLNEREIFYY